MDYGDHGDEDEKKRKKILEVSIALLFEGTSRLVLMTGGALRRAFLQRTDEFSSSSSSSRFCSRVHGVGRGDVEEEEEEGRNRKEGRGGAAIPHIVIQ